MHERVYGMRYLLDTSVLICCFQDHNLLSSRVLDIVNNDQHKFCISIVSLWEIVIKLCIKKLDANINLKSLNDLLKKKNIGILPIKQKYLKILLSLPMHHKDPFDRLLIATAVSEKLTFITSDKDIKLYNVDWIW